MKASSSTATTFSASSTTTRRGRSPSRQASTKCAWSLSTTAAVLQGRQGLALLRRQERRKRARRADAGNVVLGGRDRMSVKRPARRCRRTRHGAHAFSGKVNWVQIDLDKDDPDHYISRKSASGLRWRGSNSQATAASAAMPRGLLGGEEVFMKFDAVRLNLIAATFAGALVASCVSAQAPAALPESIPGLLNGYLSRRASQTASRYFRLRRSRARLRSRSTKTSRASASLSAGDHGGNRRRWTPI